MRQREASHPNRGDNLHRRVVAALVATMVAMVWATAVQAQEDHEYRMEIGGGAGLTAYEGDFNGSLLKQQQPTLAVVAKYRMNPRMAWAADIGLTNLKGSSDNVKTWYPDELKTNPTEFKTSLRSLDVSFEYNFWPYGTGREYRGARPFTPFIAVGAGLAWSSAKNTRADGQKTDHQTVAFQTPIGLGVKYKLRPRLNLTAQWMMHFGGSDYLDGVKDPYGIKSSGLFKNTDCFSTLQVAITYDFWAKCKTCNNDRD